MPRIEYDPSFMAFAVVSKVTLSFPFSVVSLSASFFCLTVQTFGFKSLAFHWEWFHSLLSKAFRASKRGPVLLLLPKKKAYHVEARDRGDAPASGSARHLAPADGCRSEEAATRPGEGAAAAAVACSIIQVSWEATKKG